MFGAFQRASGRPCRPDYFPVVLATWEAVLDPRFNAHSAISSSGGAAIAAVVSGPYAQTIGMNAGAGAFSPGNRANATIGRAIRIGVMTVFKAIPDELDASSFGHGGKYSFHFAERTPPPDENGLMVTARPEHILVTTAGGYGSGWSTVIPCYSALHAGYPVTKAVRLPGRAPDERNVQRAELDFA